MPKEAGMNLTCRQCGREFAFTRAEQEKNLNCPIY